MPRTIFDRHSPYDKLLALLRGTAITKDKTFTDLGGMAKCSKQTVMRRMQDPGSWTLDELRAMGRGLNIPIEDLRQSIQY